MTDTITLPDSLRPICEILEPVTSAKPRLLLDDIMPSSPEPLVLEENPRHLLSIQSILDMYLVAYRWNKFALSRSKPTVEDLIFMTRDCHRDEIQLFLEEVSDLQICHCILENALLNHVLRYSLRALHYQVGEGQELCEEYLSSWLAHGRLKVQVVSGSSSSNALYQITIVNGADRHKNWSFVRDWFQIEAFNKVLCQCIPRASLWRGRGEYSPSELVQISKIYPLVMAALLEYGLSYAFRFHARELLKTAQCVSFLRPENTIRPLSKAIPLELAMVRRLSTRAVPYGGISFQSFIPPSLVTGIAAVEVDGSATIGKIKIILVPYFGPFGSIIWIVDRNNFQEVSDIDKIIHVNLTNSLIPKPVGQLHSTIAVSQRGTDAKVLSISYQYGERQNSLRIQFNSSDEAGLVFDTLQLLRRIQELLRPSFRLNSPTTLSPYGRINHQSSIKRL